jgi:amino acid adenylation domain-containing protein
MSDDYQRKENFPLADTQGDNCAYILYTSGSTGNPKGVCISHRAAFAFVEWAAKTINAGPEDRFANHAPLHFDLSVLDLYVAWSSGARVVLVPETVSFNPKSLIDLIIEERVTVWYSVPSALMLMMDYGGFFSASLGHLRAVLFAGEAFPIKYVRELRRRLRHIRIWNLYGPTETNVCTAYEVLNIEDERISAVPIGKAVCGNRVWAVDPLGSEIGSHQIGELMVAGPTVMLGYWGRETQGDRPYATGDLVRLLPDGNYEFIGRRDEMLKVRGYRIEPGQIESVLVTHPQVREAAVVAIGTGITAYLVAIMVTTWPLPRVLVLKRHCAESLPRHMIPHEFHFVRALPRTDNGKIHRRRLPKTLKDREQPKPSEQELGFSNTAV